MTEQRLIIRTIEASNPPAGFGIFDNALQAVDYAHVHYQVAYIDLQKNLDELTTTQYVQMQKRLWRERRYSAQQLSTMQPDFYIYDAALAVSLQGQQYKGCSGTGYDNTNSATAAIIEKPCFHTDDPRVINIVHRKISKTVTFSAADSDRITATGDNGTAYELGFILSVLGNESTAYVGPEIHAIVLPPQRSAVHSVPFREGGPAFNQIANDFFRVHHLKA